MNFDNVISNRQEGRKFYIAPACIMFAMEMRSPVMENSMGGSTTDQGAEGGWGSEGGDTSDDINHSAAYRQGIWDEATIFG